MRQAQRRPFPLPAGLLFPSPASLSSGLSAGSSRPSAGSRVRPHSRISLRSAPRRLCFCVLVVSASLLVLLKGSVNYRAAESTQAGVHVAVRS